MLEWYVRVTKLCRQMLDIATDVLIEAEDGEPKKSELRASKRSMEQLFELFSDEMPSGLRPSRIGDLGRHIHFSQVQDYRDIARHDIPEILKSLESYALEASDIEIEKRDGEPIVDGLLHPVIEAASASHFKNGKYRNAALDSVVALMDLVRKSAGIEDLDGDQLCGTALNPDKPKLIVAKLSTKSGKSEQRGTMLMSQGLYASIRNPKSHTLVDDTTPQRAAQVLAACSFLASVVEQGKKA